MRIFGQRNAAHIYAEQAADVEEFGQSGVLLQPRQCLIVAEVDVYPQKRFGGVVLQPVGGGFRI